MHTCPVDGVEVAAVHGEFLPAAHGDLRHVGHEVVGDALGVLADHARGVRAHRVEVPQEGAAPVRVGGADVLDDLLHEVLGLAVGVGAVAGGVLLVHGQVLGLAVHRGGGGEHNLLHPELHHHLHQVGATRHVVPVVLEGHGAGLPDGLEGGEVDDAVDPVAALVGLGEDLSEGVLVRDVRLVEGHRLAGQVLHPQDGLWMHGSCKVNTCSNDNAGAHL